VQTRYRKAAVAYPGKHAPPPPGVKGPQGPSQVVEAGQADRGVGRVALVAVGQLLAGRRSEGVFGAGVEVGQRPEDVFAGKARRDGLRHGVLPWSGSSTVGVIPVDLPSAAASG
jgi:hypothetical protein